jgi:DNA-directed RNA polymerase subunit H (RpoH/RPB5)
MSINDKKRLLDYIHRSRGNILDMLETRNYNSKAFRNFSYETLTTLYEKHEQGKYGTLAELSPLDIKVNSKVNDSKIIVKYRLDEKFKNTASLKKLVGLIYEEHQLTENDTLIILVVNAILPKPNNYENTVFSFTEEFRIQKRYVQVYGLENHLINISKHVFVPKHIILNDDEIAEVCGKYNIEKNNFHRILSQDPMAKFLGLRLGQVVKVNSSNPIVGYTPSYKVCVI